MTDPLRNEPEPPPGSLTGRLARCYTGAVHDVLRMMRRALIGGTDPEAGCHRYGKF